MRRLSVLGVLLASSCSQPPTTALRVSITFDAGQKIDQLRLTLRPAEVDPHVQTLPDTAAPLTSGLQVVIVVPESWDRKKAAVEVLGLAQGQTRAAGSATTTIVAGSVVELSITLQCSGAACPCTTGQTQACPDIGICRGGQRRCVNGVFGACEWTLVKPQPAEVCGDKQDNNCDGQTDEGCTTCTPQCAGKPCGADDGCGKTCQTGTCADLNQTCKAGRCECANPCGIFFPICCPSTEVCVNDAVSPRCCVPDCKGRTCGMDPVCGGKSCGSCTQPNTICDLTGTKCIPKGTWSSCLDSRSASSPATCGAYCTSIGATCSAQACGRPNAGAAFKTSGDCEQSWDAEYSGMFCNTPTTIYSSRPFVRCCCVAP